MRFLFTFSKYSEPILGSQHIHRSLIGDKTSLKRGNVIFHKWSHPIQNNFVKDLISCVVKINVTKLVNKFTFINIGNQTNKSIMQVLRKNLLQKTLEIMLHIIISQFL